MVVNNVCNHVCDTVVWSAVVHMRNAFTVYLAPKHDVIHIAQNLKLHWFHALWGPLGVVGQMNIVQYATPACWHTFLFRSCCHCSQGLSILRPCPHTKQPSQIRCRTCNRSRTTHFVHAAMHGIISKFKSKLYYKPRQDRTTMTLGFFKTTNYNSYHKSNREL